MISVGLYVRKRPAIINFKNFNILARSLFNLHTISQVQVLSLMSRDSDNMVHTSRNFMSGS